MLCSFRALYYQVQIVRSKGEKMKKVTALLMFALFGLGALTANAQSKKIGMKKATAIATKRVHGTVKSKELEHEGGRWIYSFDIRTGRGKITEVNVDAYTGKVVAVDVENAAKEAKEAKEEKKEKP
jgi:uncharacterized membrane protein YkoI